MDPVRVASETVMGLSAGVRKMIAENDALIAYEESTESGSTGLTTGAGPNLEVTMTAEGKKSGKIENGKNVKEKETVKYKIEVKNKSEVASAEKVRVKVTIPDNAYYMDEKNIPNGQIKELTINIAEILPRKDK